MSITTNSKGSFAGNNYKYLLGLYWFYLGSLLVLSWVYTGFQFAHSLHTKRLSRKHF